MITSDQLYLILPEGIYKKGDIITLDSRDRGIVTKIYHRTWWRRILTKVGFDMKLTTVGITYKVRILLWT